MEQAQDEQVEAKVEGELISNFGELPAVEGEFPIEAAPVDVNESKKRFWQPTEDRVLVRPADRIEQTKSGLWLPEMAQETQYQGVIVAHGPGKYDQGMLVPMNLRVGMTVIYGRHSGQHFKIDGTQVLMMRQGDIHAYMLEQGDRKLSGSVPLEFDAGAELTNGD